MSQFVGRVLLGIGLILCIAPLAPAEEVPVTGESRPAFQEFDAWMTKFLSEQNVPGGALAIVKDGQVVYARGFGLADRETKEPVQPESLFRIASVSKPITAVAILKLVEDGQLKLDDRVLDHLNYEPHFEPGQDGEQPKFDERWKQVTIAQCLSHSGGWDRGKSYDPMFQALRMAKSLGVSLPILPEHIIRFQLGQPLDFDPGERYAYSNFGYSLLGRIIEKVSGEPYEAHVQRAVLRPLGITTARIGGSLLEERAPGEVKYYVVNDAQGTAVTGPGAGERQVPVGYGTWQQETLDSHGGWIASAPDLARFAAALDILPGGDVSRGKLLQVETIRQMFSPRTPMLSADDKMKVIGHYGLGWALKEEPLGDGKTGIVARHGGALPCTAASLMHFPSGVNLAVLFNLGQSADGKFLGRNIEGPLTELVRKNEVLFSR